MNSIILIASLLGSSVVVAQQTVDPAYLRQYYQQISAQTSGGNPEATPIFEQNPESVQQYVTPGQQIRVKDNVQEQV